MNTISKKEQHHISPYQALDWVREVNQQFIFKTLFISMNLLEKLINSTISSCLRLI
ncbi:hypothetical protein [Legionella longbeachae]|uniref:hypothetical protein n=1 Tax=Legionella longbeachae TaxID=450 RepID=UPI0001BEB898|nr:hypothetical protein [Legionella longbeachae]EEZ94508.1 conserved hypothetical protein [Legionella longbeachae D-4968]UAK45930.1 hypothetical protein K8O86_14295 [Legionella longbeachae]VEE02895.1 Uncharacterised protein [Legionella oakridgensis]HBD7398901.1 hypothetical protein [Legionella pneumophila]